MGKGKSGSFFTAAHRKENCAELICFWIPRAGPSDRVWSRAISGFIWKYLAYSGSDSGPNLVDNSLEQPDPIFDWLKLGAENEQMPPFTTRGGQNEVELRVPA